MIFIRTRHLPSIGSFMSALGKFTSAFMYCWNHLVFPIPENFPMLSAPVKAWNVDKACAFSSPIMLSRLVQHPPYLKPLKLMSFCRASHSVSRPEPRHLYQERRIPIVHQDIVVMLFAARQIISVSASSWLLSSKWRFPLLLVWPEAAVMNSWIDSFL